ALGQERTQLFEHARHVGLVRALAADLVELDPEELVDLLEVGPRQIAEALPQRAHVRVAVLEPLVRVASLLLEDRVLLRRLAEPDVEVVELADVVRLLAAPALIGGDDHAVGRAPDTEEGDADVAVAERAEDLRERVADDGAADEVIREVLVEVGSR